MQPEVTLLDEAPRRQARSFLLGKIAEYLTVCVFVLTIMAYEWAHWYFKWTPHPMLFTGVGVCLVGYAVVRITMMIPKLQALKREERAASSYNAALQQLTTSGWFVFHRVRDSQGRGIGTILVGPCGVFNLTARYASRSGRVFEVIQEDIHGTIMVGSHQALGNPRDQARRATMSAYKLLAEEGMETIPIQPVVIFPAWEVSPRLASEEETNGREETPVWIMNEAMLQEKLVALTPVLEPKEVIRLCTLFDKFSAS